MWRGLMWRGADVEGADVEGASHAWWKHIKHVTPTDSIFKIGMFKLATKWAFNFTFNKCCNLFTCISNRRWTCIVYLYNVCSLNFRLCYSTCDVCSTSGVWTL